MATRGHSVLEERVTLRTLLIALLIAGVGLWLLYYSRDNDWWKDSQGWQSFLQEVGSALLVTGLLTTVWDVYGKRAFLDEILAKAQISTEIKISGLVKVTENFNDISWKSYLQTVEKLDLLFVYARSWRQINVDSLRAVVARRGTRIRVMLPDPEDDITITSIARRFGWTNEKLLGLIRESEEFYAGLQDIAIANGSIVEVWFLPGVPQFTFYRFDRVIVFAFNSHRREMVPVSTFACEMGGTLYKFIREEFDAMIKTNGLARLVNRKERTTNE